MKKYNPEDIFKKKQQINESKTVENYNENLPMEVKKDSFYIKIINFFKKFFHIN